MLDIIGKKNWYFAFSLLLIVPGVISLFLWGLNLSIDFTGGSRIVYLLPQTTNEKVVQQVKSAYQKEGIEVVTIQANGKEIFLRTSSVNEKQDAKVKDYLSKTVKNIKQEEFSTIGPVVGKEITLNALKAILISSLLIVLYIAWSFRSVPKPASSWRFGLTAIFTLIHDVLVLLGLFSIFGHFFHVEVDSLFITALLTVMGFSVHDTIVVFDRIRENLVRVGGQSFAQVVNNSILQTLTRSLNTSWTALLVLLSLLLFGGESTRWFVAALFIGIGVGTYSSIFNAAPLLVLWQEIEAKRKKIKSNK